MRAKAAVGLFIIGTLAIGASLAFGQGAATAPVTQPAATQAAADKGPWIIEHLKAGGLTTFIQLAVSVVGLGVVIERFVHLRKNAVVPAALARDAVQLARAGDVDGLKRRVGGDSSTLAQVLDEALQHRESGLSAMSTAAGDVASRELRRHSQRCYPIAVVATIEPLLGLFGTVVGMIEAFDVVALAGSMGNPSILADSIAKALITTEVGLAIAMPALVIYHYLKNRIGIMGVELEEVVTDVINAVELKSVQR